MLTAGSVFFLRYRAALISFVLCIGCATQHQVPPIESAAPPPADEAIAITTPQAMRSSELILGTGDIVSIEVYRHADLTKSLQIDENGKINYPLIGDVDAAGLSAFQLRRKIQDALSKYLVDPQVMVSAKGMRSQKVYVLGEVSKPGVIPLEGPMSVLEAITHAGGFTIDAKNGSVVVIRGRSKPQLAIVDLESVLEAGNVSQDIPMMGGDIVYVPATFIADASRFGQYLRNILAPIIMVEHGIILGDQIRQTTRGSSGPPQDVNVIINP